MAAENQSPAREPASRGRGRGGRGRGWRGRGGGRGSSTSATMSRTTAIKPGRGGSRRGRAKNFTDSRVQAAYERQRDLKATYQAVAHALKPALQELAERSIDEVLQQPELHKQADEHFPVIRQLQANLKKKLAECDGRLEKDMQLAENTLNAEVYVAEQEFKNGLSEISEQFYESQDNCLRILCALSAKDLPVDIRDDQYEYRIITDEELDNDFGIYECYKNGYLVPYPSRVQGTEMWRKVRNTGATVATTATSAPTRGRGRGRGGIKRRAPEQPDGQPTPKKSTRGVDDGQFLAPAPMAPAPAKGLLASAAEVDTDPEGTPADEESAPGSPEPANLSSAVQSRSQARALAREKSPPLPKNIADPDEYGIRLYNQRPSVRDKGINSRLLAPRPNWFEDWEIGFRDSSNDSTKGHTRNKRGKYLDTPNTNGVHFDHWCNGYNYSALKPEDFDKQKVKLHGVHPQFGLFLPNSSNDAEDPNPYDIPGKPIVYIANPSGRISHASRSFQTTINHRRAVDTPIREKLSASMRRFCKMADISFDDFSITDYVESDENLQARSLSTAMAELESRPKLDETPPVEDTEQVGGEAGTETESEDAKAALSVLSYATAFVQAQDVTRITTPVAATPARYDAIRDVFTSAKPAAPPAPNANNMGLNFLAEMCNIETRYPADPAQKDRPMSPPPPSAAVPVSSLRGTVKLEVVTPVAPHSHIPMSAPMGYAELQQPYSSSHSRDRLSVYGSSVHASSQDPPLYHVNQEHISQPPPMRVNEYRPYHHAPPPPPPPPPPPQTGPPMHDQNPYYQHGGYPAPDPRDMHMAPTRPIDPGYSRRMSDYRNDPRAPSPSPSYQNMYWPQQPTPGPPALGTPAPPQAYAPPPPPPPQHPRIPFSSTATAEPLPPLRPSRNRNHSMPEEPAHDLGMRQSMHGNMGPYYPPAPSRAYPRAYSESQAPPLQPLNTERILPNPQQPGQNYMGSPHQGYTTQILSPTFGNQPSIGGPMAQSPPGTPQGPPGSAHRHRSTPSGSSDAGSNKYRKLQPAPVPAHRAWSNKPELKTIPYDHKETGSSAALPSSGPTQIRGWNVNQPRKRSKIEKQDRADEREDSR